MDRLGGLATEDELRRSLVEYGRICYDRRLVTSNDGNLSARLDDSRIIITPAGVCKGRLQVQDLIVVDMQGRVSRQASGRRMSSETPMHLEVYLQRPDIGAVIHAHPVFATALSVADMEFPVDILPEGAMLLGEVPTTAFAAPATAEDAEAIRALIQTHDALLLRQHGTLTCGADLDAAMNILERVEFVAEVYQRAHSLGNVQRLAPDTLRRLGKFHERPGEG
ncbi:MAG TPA: class II aldolase/adducin family protein [Anaerolineales bacterium]|nr:class II aldolase/adducin family protein [Anaerolineales bacterium]